MRALNRHVERVFNPDRKEPHWGKRKAEAGSVNDLFCGLTSAKFRLPPFGL
jgi:hypothetical protein